MKNALGKRSIIKQSVYLSIVSAMIVFVISSFVVAIKLVAANRNEVTLKVIIAVLGMMFSLILFAGAVITAQKNSNHENFFVSASVILFIILLLSGVTDILEGTPGAGKLLVGIHTALSFLSVGLHSLLWHYQCKSLPENIAKRYYMWLIVVLMSAYSVAIIVNIFNGFMFYSDAQGKMHWDGLWVDIVSIFAFYVLYIAYILPQKCSLSNKLFLSSFVVFPMSYLVIVIILFLMGIEFTVLSLTYIFILLAVYVVFILDYKNVQDRLARQKAELAEKERAETELQTALMLSQIRPHFMYNSLTAIRSLCKKDSAEAYKMIGLFAEYLHGNMDALENGRMITFEKELEHIKTYLMLEQMRFGDELQVEYDVCCTEFSLPALCVQPIVENAVRHGATMNPNGGKIKISCHCGGSDGITVSVTDNGPGFDPEALPDDGRNHFGLNNVRNCLKASGCGELHIESTIGVGTTVTILIREGK